MIKSYKRFCCGLYHIFRHTMHSGAPVFSTFGLTLILFIILIYGIDSLINITVTHTHLINKVYAVLLITAFEIANYLLVFRDLKFTDHYDKRIMPAPIMAITILITLGGLSLIFMARQFEQ